MAELNLTREKDKEFELAVSMFHYHRGVARPRTFTVDFDPSEADCTEML